MTYREKFLAALDRAPRRVEVDGFIRWYEDGKLVREVKAADHYHYAKMTTEVVEYTPLDLGSILK